MKKGYAVSEPGNTPTRRSVGDAVGYKESVGKDQMDGVGLDKPMEPPLKMSPGNILEAHGRDVSNKSVDVDGWGGEDAPYKGVAMDAPYSGRGKRE